MKAFALACLLSLPAGAHPSGRLAFPNALVGFDLPSPPETAPAVRAEERFAVDLDLSRVRFSLETRMLGLLSGRILRYEAGAALDPENGTLSSVAVTLDMDSVELQDSTIPRWMVRRFLKTKEFPTGTLRSLAVRAEPSGPAMVEVEVSSQGQTYSETVAVAVERLDCALRLSGTSRRTTPKGNKVILDFDLVFKKAP